MLRRHDIKFYTSENEDLKAAVVERFNRNLKTKMFRYFTHANTRRYLDVLDDLLHSYNNTHHRSIGMAPSEVNADNEDVYRRVQQTGVGGSGSEEDWSERRGSIRKDTDRRKLQHGAE